MKDRFGSPAELARARGRAAAEALRRAPVHECPECARRRNAMAWLDAEAAAAESGREPEYFVERFPRWLAMGLARYDYGQRRADSRQFLRGAVLAVALDDAQRAAPTMVYAIGNEMSGLIKVGISRTPEVRRAILQTGSADSLILLGAVPGSLNDERRLHEQFASDRVAGEWFRPSRAVLHWIESLDRPDSKVQSRCKQNAASDVIADRETPLIHSIEAQR